MYPILYGAPCTALYTTVGFKHKFWNSCDQLWIPNQNCNIFFNKINMCLRLLSKSVYFNHSNWIGWLWNGCRIPLGSHVVIPVFNIRKICSNDQFYNWKKYVHVNFFDTLSWAWIEFLHFRRGSLRPYELSIKLYIATAGAP